MFPLLDIEKTQKPNKLLSKNTNETQEIEGESFSSILHTTINESDDKTNKKPSKKDKKTTTKEEISDQKDLSKDKKSKNDDKEIKDNEIEIKLDKTILDKTKNKKDSNIQNELESKIKNITNTKEAPKTQHKDKEIILPKNEKELLEFTKQTSLESKRTIKDVVDEANKLKLNVKKADIKISNESKNIKSEIKHDLLQESVEKNIAPKQSSIAIIKDSKITQESKKETNILNSILNDKELITKSNNKDSKKPETKKPETKKEIKQEIILEEKPKNLDIKDIKENKDNIKPQNKETKPENIEIKNEKEVKPNNPQISKETDSKKTNKNIANEIKEEIKTEKVTAKNTEIQEIKNKDTKEAKITEIKEAEKNKVETKEINNKIEKQVSLESQNIQNNKEIKDKKVDIKQVSTEIKGEVKADIKNDNIVNKKIKNDTKKDESKVSINSQQDIRLTNVIKEEIINPTSFKEVNKDTKEADDFLNNLLKTESKAKPQEEVVSQNKEKEKTKDKEKVSNESYQGNIQSQKQDNFAIKNTFLNFGDKLKEALQQYKPPITKISLELNPERLGSVELTITKRGDNISVQISSNPQALKMFMQNKEEFKKELSNLGFNDVVLDFKDIEGNSLFGGFGDSNPHQHHQNPQNREDEQKRNENSLQAYKEAEESSLEVSSMDLSFSYYA